MKIIITKVVKHKWNKITLFLFCDISFTIAMSWTSIIASQMTKISHFIRLNIFLSKSTNFIISIMFLILFNHQIFFISVLRKERHFVPYMKTSFTNQSTLLYPRENSKNPFFKILTISDTLYYPLHTGFCFKTLVVLFPILQLSISLSSSKSAKFLKFNELL